ncbi:hypothetical protein MPTK1_4g00940 [Marchantia polymorpha subsp. ruderalis]
MSSSAVNAGIASCIRSEPDELCNSRRDDRLVVGQHSWSFRHVKPSMYLPFQNGIYIEAIDEGPGSTSWNEVSSDSKVCT